MTMDMETRVGAGTVETEQREMRARAGTIALVDDEPSLRETVGLVLERDGYSVDSYADGHLASGFRKANLPSTVGFDERVDPALDVAVSLLEERAEVDLGSRGV